MKAISPCLVFVVSLVIVTSSAADIINVPADQPTIQAGIDAASDGDEVVVAPGTYNEVINFNGKAITLRSLDGPDVTIIDGTGLNNSVVKCISGEGLDTVLDGFTITAGNADFGGGMYNFGSSPTVANCTFSGNASVGLGGAMANLENSPSLVLNCLFVDNMAGVPGPPGADGGAIHTNSDMTILNSTFLNNFASGAGGAIHNGGNGTIANCLFVGNVAQQPGGAIHNFNSCDCTSSEITGCTFFGNSTVSAGGAIANAHTTTIITNCIAWGNSDGDGMATGSQIRDVEGPVTTVVSHSDVMGGYVGEGNIDEDPLFIDPDNGDFHIAFDSPCIDVADNSVVETNAVDMDGEARIGNGVVDMGADEFYDCNNNFSPDHADIDEDTSEDCNGNLIPDECDLADGTSENCDEDAIPDECEPDSDGDNVIDDCDGCPDDPDKIEPGVCGCGVSDEDSDGDTVPDCIDQCPGEDDLLDSDDDGVPDCQDGCPDDPNKTEPGVCGCGIPDDDSDGDGVEDCIDACPGEDDNIDCNNNDTPDACDISKGDSDDCNSNGIPDECETDSDGDGVIDACDPCPADNPDDTDGDGVCDSDDICAGGDDNQDEDEDGVPDFCDPCRIDNPDDTDGDGVCDSDDICPGGDDAVDADKDGVPDFCDPCPQDNPDDTDEDGVCDSVDNCELFNPDQLDCQPNGIGDVCDLDDGTSQDCNDNAIPDECDITDGTSDDCNANGTPDECEICVGDLNCDGVVDAFDLAVLLGSWGPCDGCPADIFDDGDVNAGDLAILLGNWGPCE